MDVGVCLSFKVTVVAKSWYSIDGRNLKLLLCPIASGNFQVLLSSLDRMLETALELDTGRYSPRQSPLILYVIRLVVRVEGFLLFLRDDARCRRTRGITREDR